MERSCETCKAAYDDADCTTICPHKAFRSSAQKTQWEAGWKLFGKRVRFNHMPPGSGTMCTSLTFDGMVSIEAFPGEFAPHLFVIDEPAEMGAARDA